MKLNRASKIFLATGATLLIGALLIRRRVSAASYNAYSMPLKENSNENEPLIITDHDGVFDYKKENNRWFTKRKGSNQWIDMQASLSEKRYLLAKKRLERYIEKTRNPF